jgi:hypothetical protein
MIAVFVPEIKVQARADFGGVPSNVSSMNDSPGIALFHVEREERNFPSVPDEGGVAAHPFSCAIILSFQQFFETPLSPR